MRNIRSPLDGIKSPFGPTGLGPELITNGGFDTDTDWTKGTGWTISGGTANVSSLAGTASLSQAISVTGGLTYQITYTVSGYAAGNFRPRLTGGAVLDGTIVSADGTYVDTLVAPVGTTTFNIVAITGTTGSVDNISVRKV